MGNERPSVSWNRRRVLGTIGVTVTGGFTGAASGTAGTSRDLEGGSPRPGPDVLYDEVTTAPQFENGEHWDADPLLVCGTDAYVDGEYLYQDYVHDDYGANTTDAVVPPHPQPNDDTAYGENGGMTGDVVYPTDDETFHHNAADLLEFRATVEGNQVRYRITLNTMVDPEVTGIAIGIDRSGDEGTDDWGYGIGELGPLGLDDVLVTWGTGAEFNGEPVESTVTPDRNQIEVVVPRAPGEEVWRHYLAVGLFDADEKRFRAVKELPDGSNPGGAHGENPPPIFNVGFRFDEPVGAPNIGRDTGEINVDLETGETLEDGTETGSRGLGYGHYRDHAQASALDRRDISEFHADIDFARLRRRETERNVPESGFMTRLYSSRHELGSGVDAEEDVLIGRVQPYGVYVPENLETDDPARLHLHMHSLGSTYNEYAVLSPNLYQQLGEDRNAIVLTPGGRGPAGWYRQEAELDVFEAWNDLAARYEIDFDNVTLGGYSMGGFGTFRLGAFYPDLFARTFIVAAAANDTYEGSSDRLLDTFRSLPVLMWNGANDQLVPAPAYTATQERLRELGYRHELDVFPGYDHFTFAIDDEWGPGRDFLDDSEVPRRPSEVTYRRIPRFDAEQFDLVHNGAFWISGIGVEENADDGTISVRSLAIGEAPPETNDYERTGTEPAPHEKRGTEWDLPRDSAPTENALEIDLSDVTESTIWVTEAGLASEDPITLYLESNQEATLRLSDGEQEKTVEVPSGESEQTVEL